MDIFVGNNKEENVKKDKKTIGKGKKDDKKSKPPAGLPESRGRAKSTVVNTFEQKKGPNTKKDLKPIETIGNDRFKNLLNMFEKKPEATQNKEDTGPRKLDMSKYAFGKSNDNQDNNGSKRSSDMADGIKKKMDMLMSNNKEGGKSGSYVDPVLEQRRKQKELEAEDEDDEDYDDESEENLHISEDDDEKEESDKEEKDDDKEEKDEDKEEKDEDKEEKDEENEEKEDKEEVEKKDNEDKEDKEENVEEKGEQKNIENNEDKDDDEDNLVVDQHKESEKKEEHKDLEAKDDI
jgi:hypothetical protein